MIALIDNTTISGKIGKDILPDLLAGKGNGGVKALVEAKGLLMISGEEAVAAIVEKVFATNPKQLEEFKAGKVIHMPLCLWGGSGRAAGLCATPVSFDTVCLPAAS